MQRLYRLLNHNMNTPNTSIPAPAKWLRLLPNSFPPSVKKDSTKSKAPARPKNKPMMKRKSLSFSMEKYFKQNHKYLNLILTVPLWFSPTRIKLGLKSKSVDKIASIVAT